MKHLLKILILSVFLAIASLSTSAQVPPLPGDMPSSDKEVGGGSGAPIGNGTFILITLAVAYAVRKVYEMRSASEVE